MTAAAAHCWIFSATSATLTEFCEWLVLHVVQPWLGLGLGLGLANPNPNPNQVHVDLQHMGVGGDDSWSHLRTVA